MRNYSRNTIDAFFALMQAGLWEKEVRLEPYGKVDSSEVYSLTSEQSVVGLIAAGLEHIADVQVPQNVALTIVGDVMQLEQKNREMNEFIASIVCQLRKNGIDTLLVKGQGIAQCYERPLWRASGDVDLFLDADNYQKAKAYFSAKGENVEESSHDIKHTKMTIDSWLVELHGTLRTQLGQRIDKVVDEVQEDTFKNGSIRIWKDISTDVLLPSPDNDVVFVFTHFLQHFFFGGCGLRQICDWCRLLWTYRDSLDVALLEKRLRKAGLMSEWKAFGALAVIYLGMPEVVMPLYSSAKKWHQKADRILHSILLMGNMGHNRNMDYRQTDTGILRKLKTFYIVTKDACRLAAIFPMDSVRVWWMLNVREIKKHV